MHGPPSVSHKSLLPSVSEMVVMGCRDCADFADARQRGCFISGVRPEKRPKKLGRPIPVPSTFLLFLDVSLTSCKGSHPFHPLICMALLDWKTKPEMVGLRFSFSAGSATPGTAEPTECSVARATLDAALKSHDGLGLRGTRMTVNALLLTFTALC